ncbi:hypothetical protein [Tengunoibacter tsumagoiensis]|uniref:Uncharacterized protein n=1 Tax=Tengunoibacter tsumagoiensis TaxID=2014871 RepID=A0A402A780_9CHLR|nr:hypothetical protein [Tengunoibacter tsumagoiensis]GCE14895.1 hypothetical protein KTT_47540 [Tengunoibacter tsumagoiensis]
MNPIQAILRASLQSTSNGLRFDARLRVGTLFALLIQLLLAAWALSHLISAWTQWKALDGMAMSAHLWLTCLLAWSMIVLFAVLTTVVHGLGSDEALLLAIQPFEPATRFRALYSLVLWRGVGNWLLSEALLLGIALSLTLGWAALPWLLLLVLGALCVAWLSIFLTLLAIHCILPYTGRVLLYSLFCAMGLGLLLLLVHSLHWDAVWAHKMSRGSALLFAQFSALATVPLACPISDCLLVLCLLLAWFPLARRTGLLYLATLQGQQGRDSSPRAVVRPGSGMLLTLLKRRRTLLGALLFKGVLQQSRHLFAWLRLLVLVVLLALFPLVRPSLASLPLSDTLEVTFYAACMAFLALFEYMPYAIGGEGARLTLYLTAPLAPATFLRVRLCSYLLPTLLIGWLCAHLLGLWTGLNLLALSQALALLSLLLTGYATLTVLGSALDADLTQFVEDNLQTLMLEEMPITPRRLQLLSLTILLFGVMLLLCWKLPMPGALLALVALDALLLVIGERLARAQLARLLR